MYPISLKQITAEKANIDKNNIPRLRWQTIILK